LTEAGLLKLMEENGIGTDATRATYPRLILDRGYAVKERKALANGACNEADRATRGCG